MAKSVVGLNIKIGATVATLQRDLAQASAAVRGFGANAGGAAGQVTALSRANAAFSAGVGKVAAILKSQLVGLAAVAVSMAAATVSIRAFTDAYQDIEVVANLADKIGATTESIVGLRKAAILSGSSADAMDAALVKMSKTLGEAIIKGGESAKAFTDIGLSIKDLKNATPGEQFRLIAEAINKLGTEEEKVARTTAIFGRSASDLVNVFAIGRKGLDEFQAAVERTGEAYSKDGAEKARKYNDAVDELKGAIKGLTVALAIELAPALTEIVNAITSAIRVAKDFGGALDAIARIGGLGATGWFIVWANDAAEATAQAKRWAEAIDKAIAAQKAAAQAVADKDSMWAGWIPGTEETRDFTASFESTMTEVAAMVRERWTAIGESITDSVKTPLEKLNQKIAEIKNAFAGGFIDEDTATRAIRLAHDELDSLSKARDAFRATPSVGAAAAGTTGGFAAVQDGQRALKDLADATRRREVSDKKREKLLADAVKELGEIKKKIEPVKVKEHDII